MSRTPRKKSSTGIYHVMLRGADRRIIFSDDEDCNRFLETMKRAKKESGFRLYVWCLMGNHVHLLLKEEKEPLEIVFKRIGSAYVYYYNWKYELHGHLFQDRFKSEAVEDDAYFLDVLRYICQNPVKAGLCEKPFDYPWLGCSGISEEKELLDSFGELTDLKGERLLSFVSEPCHAEHLENTASKRLTDREAIDRLRVKCGCGAVQEIVGWPDEQRDDAVITGLNNGVSIRQLSRLTGISKAVIERIARR